MADYKIKIRNSEQLSKRKSYQIVTTLHEGAVAMAGETLFQEKSFKALNTVIQEEFAAINQWIAARGGIVGHLKSFLATTGQTAMISTTGDQVSCRLQPAAADGSNGVLVSIALIVFAIPPNDLEARLIDLFEQLECAQKKGESHDQ
jgi:hypothetical protein